MFMNDSYPSIPRGYTNRYYYPHEKNTLKLHLYFFEPYAAYTIMSAKWVFTN